MQPIQSLWVGTSLSTMEQLCIRSFLANGHEFHLYVYGPLAGVPEGTVIKDANEILPAASLFRDRDIGSFSGFSDLFRYKLQLDRGGWWVDLDLICIRPFPVPKTDHLFALENSKDLGNFVLFSRTPGSEVFRHVWHQASQKDPAKLTWCEIGSQLFWDPIRRLGLEDCLVPPQTFSPIPWTEWFDTFLPGRLPEFPPETVAVHLWHEMWRRARLDKDEDYGPRSLYQRLKLRYLPIAEK